MQGSPDPEQRAAALRELADAGGDGVGDALRYALDDPDERVRAAAAVGLAQIGDPAALEACIRAIDDAPDPMHLDVTPAVHALGQMGLEAIPALLDPLEAREELTRLHAQRALEMVIYRHWGFEPGRGFPSEEAEEGAREDLVTYGYDFEAEPAERAAAIERLRAWLDESRTAGR